MGMARAAAFGGAMEVGYLPDMFGHVAQMPQILRLAGFEHTVVWRGVPSAITKTGFWWEAPDGSTVRAEYLPVGYGNGAVLPDDAKALVRRIADHEQEIGSFLLGDLLLMNGSDHLDPQPWLGRVVAEANAIQDDYVFEITSLPEYLADAPDRRARALEGRAAVRRPGQRPDGRHLQPGRRQAGGRRQPSAPSNGGPSRTPPSSSRPTQWPARLLELAWLDVVRNAAHDSICACSVDDVVDAVLHRFAEARQIADGVAGRALDGPRPVDGRARVRWSSTRRPAPARGMVELVVGAELTPGARRPGALRAHGPARAR